ncbi:cbb3-type cytochrome c oxidase subunit II [Luteolibacter arcticus]|uniref:Cbb3-type cytochrome c oxidase subunit II n=1 Tax=Luteolibacter arcticus TaxID=1581411 RepID=A0ABT3GR74_9BACT|nr:cbb3-type cytochrome c oxidase subunit II [Luteolibacter arcticus]MCW1926023.1 cbb3-type cytochrome c oxidase subunit II [Luteolibacter arcticus]
MTFRSFAIGLTLAFGIAWLSVVVVPFFLMRDVKPVAFDEVADGKTGIYFPKRTGRVANGAEVYASNGCYLCHTQVVRTTEAGNDLGRADWGGTKTDETRGDTRRESNVFDYQGEKFAQIGVSRLGPDLSNIGLRVQNYVKEFGGDPEAWLYLHLYNPRLDPAKSTSKCPSHRFLFEDKEITGQKPAEALAVSTKEGHMILPTTDAESLVSYLLSLKRDDALPKAIDPAPAKAATPTPAAAAPAAPAAPAAAAPAPAP